MRFSFAFSKSISETTGRKRYSIFESPVRRGSNRFPMFLNSHYAFGRGEAHCHFSQSLRLIPSLCDRVPSPCDSYGVLLPLLPLSALLASPEIGPNHPENLASKGLNVFSGKLVAALVLQA
jgi:hypothetical protein